MAEEWLSRIAALLAGAAGLAMLVVTIRKMRRETRLSRVTPVVAILALVVATGLYVYLTGVRIHWLLGAPLPVLGFFIGRAEGKLARMRSQGGVAVGKRTMGYLVVWGLGYLLTVIMAQMGKAGLHAGGVLLMLLGAGMAVGCNIRLLARQASLRPEV
jgi:hypothetical protein